MGVWVLATHVQLALTSHAVVPMTEHQDQVLRKTANDEFKGLLLECLPRLRGYAITLTRSREEADDLLQETALRALRFHDQFITGTNFKAWMYCILRNQHISMHRRSKRNTVPITDVSETLLSRKGSQEDECLTREVLSAMRKLPVPQREILLLVYVEGLSYEEVATQIGCSIGTVKSRVNRARCRMQTLLLGEDDCIHGRSSGTTSRSGLQTEQKIESLPTP